MPGNADRAQPGHDNEAARPRPGAGASSPDAVTHPAARPPRRFPGQVAEPFRAAELLDETLTAALGPAADITGDAIAAICNDALQYVLGPAADITGDAIAAICNDALHYVLGPAIVSALRADRRLLPMVAPWVLDLARGLQFQSHQGIPEPPTASLLTHLGGPQITAADARRLAETVDLAAVLALGRVLDQVLGPGAGARDPRANEAAAPWLAGLKLGARIHLVLELLRLLPPAGTGGRS